MNRVKSIYAFRVFLKHTLIIRLCFGIISVLVSLEE